MHFQSVMVGTQSRCEKIEEPLLGIMEQYLSSALATESLDPGISDN